MKKILFVLFIFCSVVVQGQWYYSSSASWKPTDIAGCQLWLDAGQGITKDGSDYVSSWADQSGNGNDATQGTGAYQPLWVDATLNGEPIIRFDGSNDRLEIASSPINTANQTIFFVTKLTNSNVSAAGALVLGNYSPVKFMGWDDENITLGIRYYATWGGYTSTPNVSVVRNLYKYFTMSTSSNVGEFYMNGVLQTGNVGLGSNFTPTVVGTSYTYWGFFQGDIVEIIIYDSTLGTTDQQTVESYLATKYGLSVEWYIMGGLLIGLAFRKRKYFNQFKQAA